MEIRGKGVHRRMHDLHMLIHKTRLRNHRCTYYICPYLLPVEFVRDIAHELIALIYTFPLIPIHLHTAMPEKA